MLQKLAVVGLVFTLAACNKELSPVAPSSYSDPADPVAADVLRAWSPYMVIHTTGQGNDAYPALLQKMMGRGTIRGLRLGGEIPNINGTTKMLESFGLEHLFIFDNCMLAAPNMEQLLDTVMQNYRVTQLQFGNETTSISYGPGCGNSRNLTIDEYMTAFWRAYEHMGRNYPNIPLVTQATQGSGTGGSNELEDMVRLGLDRADPSRVIIGINAYSNQSYIGYAGTLSRSLRRFRVWVTEAGHTDPNTHASYVLERYSRLKREMRAERIYWYALWAGEDPPDCGFGLIRNVRHTPPFYDPAPLGKILTGELDSNPASFACNAR